MGILDSILGYPAPATQPMGLLDLPPSVKPTYDTALTPQEEARYQQWVKDESMKSRRDISKDTEDYDLKGLFKANGGFGENGHAPDTYKKPNHPTFSDQSMYSTPALPGGVWDQQDGKDRFTPGAANLQSYSPQQLQEYFQRAEPGVILNYNR